MNRLVLSALCVLVTASSAFAQQRPLVTEDPEPIGAGRILIEAGLDDARDAQFPVSGLRGTLVRVPLIGLSFGISSIAELQIDGGLRDILTIKSRNPNAPLASLVDVSGDTTSDFDDAVVALKIRLVPETADRPAFGIRFATRLPNAKNETGLGLNTTDFSGSLLGAKTIQSIRVVGNLGAAILTDPTIGHRQNDVITYGLSFARALTGAAEVVGELNGRSSVRSGDPFPGTESRGLMKLGGRYTTGALRVDAGVFLGLTTLDPTIGFTVGFTYVFNAFKVP
ncbi:MAG TPA: hypothetical protein VGY57_00795 [Vicinamibacterales bacterium]|nr:hypothetical protein [Vicinamibacterales bacterium]